jgi:tetratricopeptide (TPR) repeat protein
MTSSEPSPQIAPTGDPIALVQDLAAEALAAPGDVGLQQQLVEAMAAADARQPDVAVDGPDLGRAGTVGFQHALAAFYRRHRRLDSTIAACKAGVAIDPRDIALRHLWLEALFSAGRLEEAGELIDVPLDVAGGPREAGAVALLIGVDRLASRAGRIDLALDALERALAIRPHSNQLQVFILSRAEEGGRPDRAAVYRERVREAVASGLPRRLGEGLAALWKTREREPLPPAAVEWAWSLADKSAWSFEAWRAELDWATRSRQLLRQWWSAAPGGGAAEIAELVDAPDLSELRAIQAEGKAQAMAGSHCGPTWAAVQIFQACGLSFRAMGATGLAQLNSDDRTTITMREQRSATARELALEMKRGVLLGMLADQPERLDGGDRVTVDFLGHRAALSSLPARLAQRYGCPTWWCLPLWKGERIVIELERLPDPERDEPEADWIQRWLRAYLAKLEPVMRGDPRNLDLTKGIWRAKPI